MVLRFRHKNPIFPLGNDKPHLVILPGGKIAREDIQQLGITETEWGTSNTLQSQASWVIEQPSMVKEHLNDHYLDKIPVGTIVIAGLNCYELKADKEWEYFDLLEERGIQLIKDEEEWKVLPSSESFDLNWAERMLLRKIGWIPSEKSSLESYDSGNIEHHFTRSADASRNISLPTQMATELMLKTKRSEEESREAWGKLKVWWESLDASKDVHSRMYAEIFKVVWNQTWGCIRRQRQVYLDAPFELKSLPRAASEEKKEEEKEEEEDEEEEEKKEEEGIFEIEYTEGITKKKWDLATTRLCEIYESLTTEHFDIPEGRKMAKKMAENPALAFHWTNIWRKIKIPKQASKFEPKDDRARYLLVYRLYRISTMQWPAMPRGSIQVGISDLSAFGSCYDQLYSIQRKFPKTSMNFFGTIYEKHKNKDEEIVQLLESWRSGWKEFSNNNGKEEIKMPQVAHELWNASQKFNRKAITSFQCL